MLVSEERGRGVWKLGHGKVEDGAVSTATGGGSMDEFPFKSAPSFENQ